MSGSVNKIILLGNLGKDPEVRTTQFGKKIVNISLATSESWEDKETGLKKDKTEWHRIVIMNEFIADIASQYLKKGSKIYIEGQLQTRKWLDDSGVEHFTTEIIIPKYRGELIMLKDNSHHVGGFDYNG